MNAKQVYFALIGGLATLIICLGLATYDISSLVSTKAKQLATNKAQVDQLSTAQSGIARSKRDIVTYNKLAAITSKIVPQDKDQASTVRELTAIASANGVTLTTITFPSSTLGNNASGVAKTAPTTATPTAIISKPNLSQLTPVPGIPGVYSLQIIIGNNASNSVTFAKFNNFLRGLENNRRTAAVSTISIQPQNNNPSNLVFTLTINTYIKP